MPCLRLIHFPEIRWRHTHNRLKHPVKMRDVGESCIPADFRDILIRFHEHPLGVHNPCDVHILDDGAVGIPLEFPAQVVGAYIGHLGQLVYGYVSW